MRGAGAVAVVCLLVLAGCSGAAGGPETTATDTPTPSPTSEPATPTETLRPVETPTPEPAGPEPLVVAVDTSNTTVPRDAALAAAAEYWSEHSEQYLNYRVPVQLRENPADPDVRLRFVENVTTCGEHGDYLGCAERYRDGVHRVRLQRGYTNATVRALAKHELGHVFGLEHGDAPTGVMAARQPAVQQSVLVQIRAGPRTDRRAVREEVQTAIDTWERSLAASGHYAVRHRVELVDSFDADADLRYEATGDRDACDGDPVCYESTRTGDIHIVTADLRRDDYSLAAGLAYRYVHRVDNSTVPDEFRGD